MRSEDLSHQGSEDVWMRNLQSGKRCDTSNDTVDIVGISFAWSTNARTVSFDAKYSLATFLHVR
jgi:hypothetical protein